MTFDIQIARRLGDLPENYVFSQVAKAKEAARWSGLKIIDFGIGDPTRGTPPQIIESMCRYAQVLDNHRYPDTEGTPEYRQAWASLYERDWGVQLDPETQVHALIGGKEGIGHIALALLNPGDTAIVPDPGYPVYGEGTILASGEPYYLELSAANGFLPDFQTVSDGIAQAAKIFWINSPGNPTGAVAPLDYFEKLVQWAKKYNVIVCADATYSHINGGDGPTPSFMQVEGAKEVGVEFHSVSKTLCATGFRLGIVVGNAEIIAALHRVKASLDSGQAKFIELAFAEHMLDCNEFIGSWNSDLTQMRRAMQDSLVSLGFQPTDSDATFYVWAAMPEGFTDSEAFADDLIRETGVVCVPGKGLGIMNGEGFVRFSLAAAVIDDIERSWSLIHEFIASHR